MATMSTMVGFKQFRTLADSKADACLSYIVFDPLSKEGMIVDPHSDAMDDYSSFLAEHSIRLKAAVDTQVHWGYLSATQLLRSRFGCEIAMSDRTTCHRVTQKLRDHDHLHLGKFEFEVLQTPGVSPDAITLVGSGLLFSGNTLWINSSAPSTFPAGDTTRHWASLQVLKQLSDTLVILPAYDCNEMLFSTLAVEKRKNTALKQTQEQFIDAMNSSAVPMPDLFKKIHEANLADSTTDFRVSRLESVFGLTGKVADEDLRLPSVTNISAEKYLHKIEEKLSQNAFIDVREKSEFDEGHIPDTVNWPMAEVGMHIQEIADKKRIYVSCLGGKRSSLVARTLSYLGFTDVVNVTGGFKAWQNAGYKVVK